MYDLQVRVTSVYASACALLSAGLLIGAWWVPFLGWGAVLAGLGVVVFVLTGEHHRTRTLVRAVLDRRGDDPPGSPPRPIR